MRSILPILLFVGMASSSFAKDCSVPRFYMVFGSDTQVQMEEKSGKPCFVNMNAGMSVESGSVVQGAAHGNATMPNLHRWGYQSKGGYSGSDHFVVELTGTGYVGRGRHIPITGSTKIDVDVTVTP